MDSLVGAVSHRGRAQENRKGCSRGRQREDCSSGRQREAVCKVVLKRKRCLHATDLETGDQNSLKLDFTEINRDPVVLPS